MSRVIDAAGLRVGRLATVVAKAALAGETIAIINAEQAVMTGNRDVLIKKYQAQYERGRNTKGPFQPRMADRFVRRIIRSMLPTNTQRGRDAFRRVMCYIGNPNNAQGESLEAAHVSGANTVKITTVKEICQSLGGRQ